ncbi:class I SAM-dependent methyltransferase [Nocardia thraciensis]
MPGKHPVALGAAQETLLIPLYARALETRKRRPLVADPRAVAMVERIDYDFARLGTGRSMIGSVMRGLTVDAWVGRFLTAHPSGTVVEIGAGLNTRYERLDNGTAGWVEFDLPDVIALRRQFFDETERRTILSASAVDDTWVAAVRERPGPYLFVSEAVLIYLPQPDAATAVGRIQREFPGSDLILDSFSPAGLAALNGHDTLRHMSARPGWAIDDPPTDFAAWDVGLSVLESRTVTDPPGEVRDRLPWRLRATLALVDRSAKAAHYRLHRLHVAGAPPRKQA